MYLGTSTNFCRPLVKLTTITVVSVEAAVRRWYKRRQGTYLHVSRYLYDFLQASGEGYCSTIQIKSFIEETGGITTITVVSMEAAVRRRCRRRQGTYLNVSGYFYDFLQASSEAYCRQIKSFIEETGCITTISVISVESAVRRRCRRGQGMYLHVSGYLYNFLQASGEGYCSTIQIKSFIEQTGGITTITVVSVEAAVRRRRRWRQGTYLHVSWYLHDFLWASSGGYCSNIQIKSFIEHTWCITTIAVLSVEAAVRQQRKRHQVCIYRYLGTYMIFCRPLEKVNAVAFKLNHLLNKLGV